MSLTAAHLSAIQTATESEALAMVDRLEAAATAAGVPAASVTAALAEAILPTPAPVWDEPTATDFSESDTPEVTVESAVRTLLAALGLR